jgi:hypothetical protein
MSLVPSYRIRTRTKCRASTLKRHLFSALNGIVHLRLLGSVLGCAALGLLNLSHDERASGGILPLCCERKCRFRASCLANLSLQVVSLCSTQPRTKGTYAILQMEHTSGLSRGRPALRLCPSDFRCLARLSGFTVMQH